MIFLYQIWAGGCSVAAFVAACYDSKLLDHSLLDCVYMSASRSIVVRIRIEVYALSVNCLCSCEGALQLAATHSSCLQYCCAPPSPHCRHFRSMFASFANIVAMSQSSAVHASKKHLWLNRWHEPTNESCVLRLATFVVNYAVCVVTGCFLNIVNSSWTAFPAHLHIVVYVALSGLFS